MDMPPENIVHIEDVSRTTSVATILQVVSARLDRLGFGSMSLKMAIMKYTPDTGGLAGLDHEAPAPNLGCADEDMEDASAPSHPLVHMVDSASSVEAEDLFNNMHRIVITNLPDKDVWEAISMVNLHAHNVNPGAPEHLAMVNHLIEDNALTSPC